MEEKKDIIDNLDNASHSDVEEYRRKIKKYNKFKRRQIIKGIDKYIKDRVYVISISLIVSCSLIITIMTLSMRSAYDLINYQSLQIEKSTNLLEKCSKDSLMLTIVDLTRGIDSLQTLIFAYNYRFQQDQANIFNVDRKKNTKHVINKLAFPKHVGQDSTKYNFKEDSTQWIDAGHPDSLY